MEGGGASIILENACPRNTLFTVFSNDVYENKNLAICILIFKMVDFKLLVK